MRKIAILNFKGGAGKITTGANLSHASALKHLTKAYSPLSLKQIIPLTLKVHSIEANHRYRDIGIAAILAIGRVAYGFRQEIFIGARSSTYPIDSFARLCYLLSV